MQQTMRKWMLCGAVALGLAGSSFAPSYTNVPYTIVVRKAAGLLQVYEQAELVAEYKVVFGSNDLRDKMYEGDRRTPEGKFTIITKKPHAKWHKIMHLSYPTALDYEVFKERKAKGLIPANARIGGGIAIHGTWPNDDEVVDKRKNWTLGCVSMKNLDLDELASNIEVGTEVQIYR